MKNVIAIRVRSIEDEEDIALIYKNGRKITAVITAGYDVEIIKRKKLLESIKGLLFRKYKK